MCALCLTWDREHSNPPILSEGLSGRDLLNDVGTIYDDVYGEKSPFQN